MFKCKEQVTKYNSCKLTTLCLIKCFNYNIKTKAVRNIRFYNEPVLIIYKDFCLIKDCFCFIQHHHIEKILKFIGDVEQHFYNNYLVDTILPFNEFSNKEVDEQRRRAVKRKLNF